MMACGGVHSHLGNVSGTINVQGLPWVCTICRMKATAKHNRLGSQLGVDRHRDMILGSIVY